MLPRNVRLSILLVQLVSIATLMRSVALDRWITVFASLMLLLGAAAAKRNRAWGVALMFAQAIAFPVAFMIGIAPPWFCLVGAIGMIPFMLTAPGFAKVDRGATRLLASIALAGGSLGAILWKYVAYSVFEAFPSLAPSITPQHGFITAAIAALGIATAVRNRKLVDEDDGEAGSSTGASAHSGTHARIAAPARIASIDEAEAEAEEEVEEEVLGRRMRG